MLSEYWASLLFRYLVFFRVKYHLTVEGWGVAVGTINFVFIKIGQLGSLHWGFFSGSFLFSYQMKKIANVGLFLHKVY